MGINVWVTRAASSWHTLTEGRPNSVKEHYTQKEAIADGRKRAKKLKGELIVQNKYGQIRQKDSFGNDPSSTPG